MTNLDPHPSEMLCRETPGGATVIEPRSVPLGGVRAMTVRRTLPSRQRSLIGPWCFVDHYGPDDVGVTGGMRVPPHPHTGLQTVSWLFSGHIEHNDSTGAHAIVRPGELNLMTAGSGIAHSEVSTADTEVLHGVQLWVALPNESRFTEPGFEHYVPAPLADRDTHLRVFLGSLAGATSPVRTFTDMVGAELALGDAGFEVGLEAEFEHGLLVDSGVARIDRAGAGTLTAPAGVLVYLPPGLRRIRVSAADPTPTRVVLLGGVPFGEEIVMWWNLIGRSHDEIVAYRANWQADLAAAPGEATRQFGPVRGFEGAPLPAPPLPGLRLRPRGNPPG